MNKKETAAAKKRRYQKYLNLVRKKKYIKAWSKRSIIKIKKKITLRTNFKKATHLFKNIKNSTLVTRGKMAYNFSYNKKKFNLKVVPKKQSLLRILTGVMSMNLTKNSLTPKEQNLNSLHKQKLLHNELSLGFKNYRLKLLANIGVDTRLLHSLDELRGVFRAWKRMARKKFKTGRFAITFFLLILLMDTSILSDYLNSIFFRTPFYFQRRLFYNIRKIWPRVFRICSNYSQITGIYFSLKGKIASRGGQRKKVLRAYSGLHNNSNFGLQYKYKFKQVWAKSGAIGLKTVVIASNYHKYPSRD